MAFHLRRILQRISSPTTRKEKRKDSRQGAVNGRHYNRLEKKELTLRMHKLLKMRPVVKPLLTPKQQGPSLVSLPNLEIRVPRVEVVSMLPLKELESTP